jgi:hypothetical protein
VRLRAVCGPRLTGFASSPAVSITFLSVLFRTLRRARHFALVEAFAKQVVDTIQREIDFSRMGPVVPFFERYAEGRMGAFVKETPLNPGFVTLVDDAEMFVYRSSRGL